MHFDWWTLALQTVNVLVLIWILARFFFRPVADIVAKRQAEADKLLARRRRGPPGSSRYAHRSRQGARRDRRERDRLIARRKRRRESRRRSADRGVSGDIANVTARRRRRSRATRPRRTTRRSHGRASLRSTSRGVCWRAFRPMLRRPPSSMASVWSFARCPPRKKRASRRRLADHPIEVVTATPVSNEEEAQYPQRASGCARRKCAAFVQSDAGLIAGIELQRPQHDPAQQLARGP